MVVRLLKFAVVAAVLWAVWHGGEAQWQQFVFEDDLKQIAQFGGDRGEEAIRAAVMAAAATRRVPLSPDGLRVRMQAERVYIDTTYTVPVEVLPRLRYSWTFTASAEGWFVPGGRFRPSR